MSSYHAAIDHLVVAAATLEEAAAWCETVLGVAPDAGGRHPAMATHNRLLNLSSERDGRFPRCYLELIAIDPGAPPPGRPRWFGLDELALASGPQLIHVVARTSALDAQLGELRAAGARPVEALAMSRASAAGLLTWRIGVAPDGRLDGALPSLIQRDDESQHPCTRLPARGVRLDRLCLAGLDPAVQAALNLPGVDFAADSTLAACLIEAEFDTPRGRVTLRAAAAPTSVTPVAPVTSTSR